MAHVILLGDSVFDNRLYVGDGPAVIDQLPAHLPSGWKATLCAVDGDTASGVRNQLERVPGDASHLVLSVGGNDALGDADVLQSGAATVADALEVLAARVEAFEQAYRAMLGDVLARNVPTAVCTVYYPRFDDPAFQRPAVVALATFNDVILRAAFEHGVPLIDLRMVATEASDYANPIEPSSRGGDKICAAIARTVTTHDFSARRSVVYTTR